jgi:ABC-type phosphate transport system ATPase subunit
VKIGVHFVYENIRFGLLVHKHDGNADFATPGNTRATTLTQILKKNLNICFQMQISGEEFDRGCIERSLAVTTADILVRYINQSLGHPICYLSASLLELM